MRTSAFRYERARSIPEVLDALARGATPLAGGQGLVQVMKLRQRAPEALVDINGVAELAGVEVNGQDVLFGPMMRVHELIGHPVVQEHLPWLATAARRLGDVQVRNRATLGGNVCFADPRANLSPVLIALGAELEVRSSTDTRRIPVEQVYRGFRTTTLAAGELVTRIRVPRWPADTRGDYRELALQPNGVPLANVAVLVSGDPVSRAGVGVGGVAQRPLRATAVQERLLGARLDEALAHTADALDVPETEGFADIHATTDYRLHIARVLLRRVLTDLTREGNR